MNGAFQRTRRLIGEAAMEKLARSRVAVFGLGGVGGSCAEALARSGVGTLDLIDSDEVVLSNLNRQAFATRRTIGKKKTDAAKERIKDISPSAAVNPYPIFYLPETADQIPFEAFDYVVDAIDTVTAKIDLILRAKAAGVPIISCMGTGNRLDPSLLEIKDIYKTYGDPLAKVMRHELRKRNVESLEVCCSAEKPIKPLEEAGEEENGKRRSVPASSAFVPPSAGILIASHVVRRLICECEKTA